MNLFYLQAADDEFTMVKGILRDKRNLRDLQQDDSHEKIYKFEWELIGIEESEMQV